MAIKTWIGSVDSDWNEGNNWSPSGVPGVADNCLIAGDVPIDGGTINNAVLTIDLARDYVGRLGDSVTALDILGTPLLNWYGHLSDSSYVDASALVCNYHPGNKQTLTLTGFDECWVGGGRLIGTGNLNADLWVGEDVPAVNTPHVTIDGDMDVHMAAGTVVVDGGINVNLDISGGSCIVEDGNLFGADMVGGLVDYRADSQIGTVYLVNGILIISAASLPSSPDKIFLFPNGTLDLKKYYDGPAASGSIFNIGGEIVRSGDDVSAITEFNVRSLGAP